MPVEEGRVAIRYEDEGPDDVPLNYVCASALLF